MFRTLNIDCIRHIEAVCARDVTILARMMGVCVAWNEIGMALLGAENLEKAMTARNEISRKNGRDDGAERAPPLHLGLLLSAPNQKIAKERLIRGRRHREAVLSMTCMLCLRPCGSISEYGFVGHLACVERVEDVVDRATNSRVDEDMIPHLKGLRVREVWDEGGRAFLSIMGEIDGVYPYELSLEGYVRCNPLEVARARETAATIERERVERMVERGREIREEIAVLTGGSFEEWVDDLKDCPSAKRTRAAWNATPRGQHYEFSVTNMVEGFVHDYVPLFKSGKDVIEVARELKKHPGIWSNMGFLMHTKPGETIDTKRVYEIIESFGIASSAQQA